MRATGKTLRATEGRAMIFRRFDHAAKYFTSSQGTLCMLSATLAIIMASGCRTPWRATSSQPDFDRLIEIERQQSGRPANQQREPLAARHRPVGSSSYTAGRSDERYADEFEMAANDNPRGSAQRSVSDRDESDRDDSDSTELEEMLVDVPPAQRDLLRREMTAMRASGMEKVDPAGPNDNRLAAASPARASRRITDSENPADSRTAASAPANKQLASKPLGNKQFSQEKLVNAPADQNRDSSQNYVGDSKYQMAANGSQRSARDTVPPRAVEQPYTRGLPDASESRSLSAGIQPVVNVAPATSPAGPVVPASYSEVSPSIPTSSSHSDLPQLTWREHIQQALQQLEQESAAVSPEEQVHRGMVDRLLQLSLGDINAASEPIDGLQSPGQDFIRHSLKSLYEVGNPAGNPVEIKRYTLAMLSQREALNQLAAVSNLEVQNATFCTEVDGFGVVTKFPQYNFKADQELLLYCELDNFVSTHIEGKGYETQLQGSYEIVDSNGRRVADQLLPLDSHLCRNHRRDYFIAYRIYMPPKIEPGKYQLKLTVEDLKGRKFGQTSMDFRIDG